VLNVTPTIRIPLAEFTISYARSSGPGGQNVNKVNSKAMLRWGVTRTASLPEPVRQRLLAKHRRRITAEGDLLIVSQRFRDAGRNTADCLEKLRGIVLAAAQPVRRRKATHPTRGSIERRLEAKRRQSQKKRRRGPGID
jgi:ribosome-associated protein